MFSRHMYLVVGLLVAGAAPYLSSKTDLKQRVSSWVPPRRAAEEQESLFKLASADSESVVSTAATSSPTVAPPNASYGHSIGSARVVSTTPRTAAPKHAPVDGSRPIRFEEVFRLDVNSAWLMARWPRVSTGLAELDLHGYRVSLLTGMREDDLAGALTYYYDKDQVIQKMTFRGVTGDPRRLVLFCTTQFGLERETVSDPALQVYRTKGTGRKVSELVVRPAHVIRADAPRERFEVDFVLLR
jgi:hypothetical protein